MSSLARIQAQARANASSFTNPLSALALAMQGILVRTNNFVAVVKKVKPPKKELSPIVAKKTEPSKVAQRKKGQQMWNKHVESIPKLSEGVLIFELSKASILKLGKFQIVNNTIGVVAPVKKVEGISLESVRVDMVSFDKHCTISGISINAIPKSGLCRVFVNFKSAIDDPVEHWGKGTIYEKLLGSTLFAENWCKVKIKNDMGKTSIVLKKPDPNQRSTSKTLLKFSGQE